MAAARVAAPAAAPGKIVKPHQLFLQSMMSRHYMSDRAFRRLHERVSQAYSDEFEVDESLEEFVEVINAQLRPMYMEIRTTRLEEDGARVWGLVNSLADESTKLATRYGAHEIAFFKQVLERIIHSEMGSIDNVQCLNLVREVNDFLKAQEADAAAQSGEKTNDDDDGNNEGVLSKNVGLIRLSGPQVEALLKRLVKDGWLINSNGNITLGARSLLELKPTITASLGESASKCVICRELVIIGDDDEHGMMHYHCQAAARVGGESAGDDGGDHEDDGAARRRRSGGRKRGGDSPPAERARRGRRARTSP